MNKNLKEKRYCKSDSSSIYNSLENSLMIFEVAFKDILYPQAAIIQF